MKFLYEKTANKPTDSNLAPISAEQVTTCVDDIPSSTPIQSINATKRKCDEMLLLLPVVCMTSKHVKM